MYVKNFIAEFYSLFIANRLYKMNYDLRFSKKSKFCSDF
ncbi:hypothetical protein CLV48_103201 [Cecembia rubra]|uniref:Uncharacterized protein n=1 Tax=Cecembia rubra TaxID=1485585 RepID=A0A2P8E881_9BACT|nr:hypothetical protein CLV48_103201 [Cecembia rubra]